MEEERGRGVLLFFRGGGGCVCRKGRRSHFNYQDRLGRGGKKGEVSLSLERGKKKV